jgi:hypothetical protein
MSFEDNTEAFRISYREAFIGKGYSGTLHFMFTTGWCLAIIIGSALQLESVSWKEWLVVPITFFYANFIEYVGHKGPMHHRKKWLDKVFTRHTLQHHRFFTQDHMECESLRDFQMILFPPILLIFFFLGFAVPATLLVHWLWSSNAAWLLLATLIAYYLNYEWLHLSYHLPESHWISKLPVIRKLRELHLNHHNPKYMQKYNFNISYPIFDWVFGTLKKRNQAT